MFSLMLFTTFQLSITNVLICYKLGALVKSAFATTLWIQLSVDNTIILRCLFSQYPECCYL